MRSEPSFAELLRGRVPEGAEERLARYGTMLETWGARHNLVKAEDRKELVERHLVEALAVVGRLQKLGRLLDVGSGAGLPGVPILCAKPEWSGVLLEPRMKRWAFLKAVVRELDLDVEVVRERFQTYRAGCFDLITSRAVGNHEALLDWAVEQLAEGGSVVLWGTAEEDVRLRGLGRWAVLSSPVLGLDRGRLLWVQKSST